MPITKISISKQLETAAIGGSPLITDSSGTPRYITPGVLGTVLISQGPGVQPIFGYPDMTWEQTLLATNGSNLTQPHTIDNDVVGNAFTFVNGVNGSFSVEGAVAGTTQIGGGAIANGSGIVSIGESAGADTALAGVKNTNIGISAGTIAAGTGDSVFIGYSAGGGMTASASVVVIGSDAANGASSGAGVIIGRSSGSSSNTTGSVVYIGTDTGSSASGDNPIAIGNLAANFLRGDNNISIGLEAARISLATADNHRNISIGYRAMYNLGGNNNVDNIFIGYQSGKDLAATSTNNVGIGVSALDTASGNQKVAIGYEAGMNTAGISGIVAIGYRALKGGVSVGNTIAIGLNAGITANGAGNILVGEQAGNGINGTRNIVIGELSGLATVGNDNVIIGRSAGGSATTTGSIFIGQTGGSVILPNLIRIRSGAGNAGTFSFDGTDSWGIGNLHPNSATTNLEVTGTRGMIIPSGTDAERPSFIHGNVRYSNTSLGLEAAKGSILSGPFTLGSTSANIGASYEPVFYQRIAKSLADTTVNNIAAFQSGGVAAVIDQTGIWEFEGCVYFWGQTVANTPNATMGIRLGFNYSGTLGATAAPFAYQFTLGSGAATGVIYNSVTNFAIGGSPAAATGTLTSVTGLNIAYFFGYIHAASTGTLTLLGAPENTAGAQAVIRMGSNIKFRRI
jgi:hypothetical protein